MKKNVKALLIVATVAIVALGIVYGKGVYFYTNHFYNGTVLKAFNCPKMTVAEAKIAVETGIQNYKFTIYENDGEEFITGDEIDLKATSVNGIEKALENQNPWLWCFNKSAKYQDIDISFTYDNEKLYDTVMGLECISKSIKAVKDAHKNIVYDKSSKQFIVKEDGIDISNVISGADLAVKVKGAVDCLYPDMSLKTDNVYCDLKYDDTINMLLLNLNTNLASEIQYLKGSQKADVLTSDIIQSWYGVSDNFEIVFNEEALDKYLSDLSESYNSFGGQHSFVTTGGSTITVSGGDYGWRIDKTKEKTAIKEALPLGQKVEREPELSNKPYNSTNSLTDNYVEVSLSDQHLWVYKDGKLAVDSAVVTGNPFAGHSTTPGVYSLKYKARNVVLRGPGYASPVTYWMPFNGGQGLHDATWRGAFGGQIYRGGGSHGCVNLPYAKAGQIFSTVEAGFPVIVY